MLLSLGSTLLIFLTTASFAVRKGLYRSTIVFLYCLVAAVVAFSYYEGIYALINVEFLQFYGPGLPLILLFVITALVLDLLSERFLTGTMRLPVLIDRVGGGFVGFWASMIAIGMLCIGLQMMPWYEDVLGFQRVYRDDQRKERVRHLLLRPDEFTVGVVGYLSDNIFTGDQSFRAVHPDLLTAVARNHTRVQPESRGYVPPEREGAPLFDVISLTQIEDPQLGYARLIAATEGRTAPAAAPGSPGRRGGRGKVETEVTSTATREPTEGHRYVVARCKLRSEAADDDKWHRFTPQQVRMVGKDSDGKPRQYFAVGYREPSRMEKLGLVSPDQPILFEARSGEYVFDLVFEVPEKFTPTFVEYKQTARAEVQGQKIPAKPMATILASLKGPVLPGESGTTAPVSLPLEELRKRVGAKGAAPAKPPVPKGAPKPAPKPVPKPESKPPGQPSAAGGRVGGRLVQAADFGPQLPFTLSSKDLTEQQAELSGAALKSGHVVVPAANARADPSGQVTAFAVPPDVRLLRLHCDALQAKSLLGKALAGAVKTVAQYVVVDEAGRQYFPIGEYRIASVGGQMLLELQYDAEGEPGRSIRPPKQITEAQLQEGSSVVLLYHVPPGAHLVRFTAGPHALANAELDATAPG